MGGALVEDGEEDGPPHDPRQAGSGDLVLHVNSLTTIIPSHRSAPHVHLGNVHQYRCISRVHL